MVIVFDGLDNPWPDEGLLRCIPAPKVPETAESGEDATDCVWFLLCSDFGCR